MHDVGCVGGERQHLLGDRGEGAPGVGGCQSSTDPGEPATLRPAERRAVVDVCAEACVESNKPLMVGVGSNCTQSTIDDLAALEGVPAPAAFLVVVPSYTRPTPAGIVDHFRAVAAAPGTPVVAYNVPYRTGRGLDADALVELAGTPGIVGVKQARATPQRRSPRRSCP